MRFWEARSLLCRWARGPRLTALDRAWPRYCPLASARSTEYNVPKGRTRDAEMTFGTPAPYAIRIFFSLFRSSSHPQRFINTHIPLALSLYLDTLENSIRNSNLGWMHRHVVWNVSFPWLVVGGERRKKMKRGSSRVYLLLATESLFFIVIREEHARSIFQQRSRSIERPWPLQLYQKSRLAPIYYFILSMLRRTNDESWSESIR